MNPQRQKRRCISYDLGELLPPCITREITMYLEENIHSSYLYSEENKSVIPCVIVLAYLTFSSRNFEPDDFEIYKDKIFDKYPEYSNYVKYFEKWPNALHMFLEENVNSNIKTSFLVQGILSKIHRDILSPRSLNF